MVSQGAAPIGPELTITAGEGHVIGELAGKPALEKLRETIEELPPEDLRLVQGGLLVGIVVDSNKPDYLQGDFLVRGLVGADPATGQVAIAADVHPGQVVRLHARDAESADRDLREALSIRMTALGGRPPAGALLFACNGRGRSMFGRADHDAEAVADALAGAPGRRVLRRGRDRPGRRRLFPAQLHGNGGGIRMNLDGARVLLTGATGGLGPGDRARAGRARRVADAHGPARRRAGAARVRGRRAGDRGRPVACPTRPSGCWRRPARSTCWSPTPASRASGKLTSFSRRGDRPRAERQPARADAARARR